MSIICRKSLALLCLLTYANAFAIDQIYIKPPKDLEDTSFKIRAIIEDEIETGKLDNLWQEYDKLVDLTQFNSEVTGNTVGNPLSDKLQAAQNKLKKTNSKASRSKILSEIGQIEYDLGCAMNFKYPNDPTPMRYHLARSFRFLNESIKLKDNGISHRYKGMVYWYIESPVSLSIEEYKLALKLDPKDDMTYYKLGVAYNYYGKYDVAIETYSKGMSLNPYNEMMMHNLLLLYQNEKNDKAKAYKIADLFIKNCSTYCYVAHGDMASLLLNDNKMKEGLNHADLAVGTAFKMKINYRRGYHLRGYAFLQLKNYINAVRSYELSLNSPNDPETYDNEFNQNINEEASYEGLCYAYAMIDQVNDSYKCTRTALEKYPDNKYLNDMKDTFDKLIKENGNK